MKMILKISSQALYGRFKSSL